MFERFTREAREAVSAAISTAHGAGDQRCDTRHLALVLLESPSPRAALWDADADAGECVAALQRSVDGATLDAEALAAIGVDLEAVSARVDAVFGPDALRRAARRKTRVPVAPDVKKALQLALRETIRLRERNIDTRHLLLGVLRADCPARQILSRYVDVAMLREALDKRAAA